MSVTDLSPGCPAPATGFYRLLNIFGSETGSRVEIAAGEPLPSAPVGHSWRLEQDEES